MKLKQIIIVTVLCGVYCDESGPKVNYRNGWVVGKTFRNSAREFEGFLGIPFAQAPVGDMRLRDPQPFRETFSNESPYDATQEKPFCAQKNYLIPNPVVMGVEDCLYLYVYRPKQVQIARNRRSQKLLPVLVYIHGGGFFSGGAGPTFSGADYIMETGELVFVTISYRVGPLGFLSTGDDNMSGNFGLKDQAMALKWVNDNIGQFGGDPSKITLMGHSAGASSVHLHMMSEMTKNLFQKAIVLSGNANGPYNYVVTDPLAQARKFASFSGIPGTDSMSNLQLSKTLRSVDVADLLNASDKFKVWSIDPLVINRLVVEDCSVRQGYMCDDPVKLWRAGSYARMPFLTGFMDGDGGVRSLAYLNNQTLLADLNEKFDELMPELLEISPADLEKVLLRYLNGRHILFDADWRSLLQLYTERSFLAPMLNTLHQMVLNDRKSQAFLYKFSFKGLLSYSALYTGNFTHDFGVPVHGDELIYLLKTPAVFQAFQDFEAGSRDAEFRKNFVRFLTDFVVNGKLQSANGEPLTRCTKNEHNAQGIQQLQCNYIVFNDKVTVKSDDAINYDAVDFWNQLDDTLVRKK